MSKSLSILCTVLVFAVTTTHGETDSDLKAVMKQREANLSAIEKATEDLYKAGVIQAEAVLAAKVNRLRFMRDAAEELPAKILWQEELVKVSKQWYDMELARSGWVEISLKAMEFKEVWLAERQRLLEMSEQINVES